MWINSKQIKKSWDFKHEDSDDSDFFDWEQEDPFMKEMKFTESQVNQFKAISQI